MKPDPRENTDDKTALIDLRENESTPAQTVDKDDVERKDPQESLEGAHLEYRHVVESDTVAELEEIFVAEKAKIELNDMVGSDFTGRDITLEESKVRVYDTVFVCGLICSRPNIQHVISYLRESPEYFLANF